MNYVTDIKRWDPNECKEMLPGLFFTIGYLNNYIVINTNRVKRANEICSLAKKCLEGIDKALANRAAEVVGPQDKEKTKSKNLGEKNFEAINDLQKSIDCKKESIEKAKDLRTLAVKLADSITGKTWTENDASIQLADFVSEETNITDEIIACYNKQKEKAAKLQTEKKALLDKFYPLDSQKEELEGLIGQSLRSNDEKQITNSVGNLDDQNVHISQEDQNQQGPNVNNTNQSDDLISGTSAGSSEDQMVLPGKGTVELKRHTGQEIKTVFASLSNLSKNERFASFTEEKLVDFENWIYTERNQSVTTTMTDVDDKIQFPEADVGGDICVLEGVITNITDALIAKNSKNSTVGEFLVKMKKNTEAIRVLKEKKGCYWVMLKFQLDCACLELDGRFKDFNGIKVKFPAKNDSGKPLTLRQLFQELEKENYIVHGPDLRCKSPAQSQKSTKIQKSTQSKKKRKKICFH